jgi:lactoylglutathione lyase
MRYLHTMVRVHDLDASLRFYRDILGMKEMERTENEKGRFTLVFPCAPGDEARAREQWAPVIELTYNWPDAATGKAEQYTGGRNFGHMALRVDDINATCKRIQDADVTINRPPRDGHMAFVRSPDGISIELLQEGKALAPAEPWNSMANAGSW